MNYIEQDWQDVRRGDTVVLQSKSDDRLVISGVVHGHSSSASEPGLTLYGGGSIRFGFNRWSLNVWSPAEKENKMPPERGPFSGYTLKVGDKVTLERCSNKETLVTGQVSLVGSTHILVEGMSQRFHPESWAIDSHTPAPRKLPTSAGVYVVDGSQLSCLTRLFRRSAMGEWYQIGGAKDGRCLSDDQLRNEISGDLIMLGRIG